MHFRRVMIKTVCFFDVINKSIHHYSLLKFPNALLLLSTDVRTEHLFNDLHIHYDIRRHKFHNVVEWHSIYTNQHFELKCDLPRLILVEWIRKSRDECQIDIARTANCARPSVYISIDFFLVCITPNGSL